MLIPIGASLTCVGEVLTPFGEFPTPIERMEQPAENVSLREILSGLSEIVIRLCEVLVRVLGLLPRLSFVWWRHSDQHRSRNPASCLHNSIVAPRIISGGRRNHPRLRATGHGVSLAITAFTGLCRHALLLGPEAAVAPAATTAVLGTPGIRDLGAGGFDSSRQAQKRHGQKNNAHRILLSMRATQLTTSRVHLRGV